MKTRNKAAFKANLLSKLLLVMLACLSSSLMAQENCGNGIDDDGDGYVDAQDIDCGCDPSTEAFPSDQFWFFGNQIGIDFAGGSITEITGGSLNATEASATAVDALGNLLFYTNGETIWDATGSPMPNGTGLVGSESSHAGALTFPLPGNEYQHYVITAKEYDGVGGQPDSVCYSIIDMRANGGDGDVITKNVKIRGEAEGVFAIPHLSDGNYWVITSSDPADQIYVTEMTASGPGAESTFSFGMNISPKTKIAVSPSLDRIAVTNHLSGQFALFDFNRSNGFISNMVLVDHFMDAYDAAFSHDGQYLYVSNSGGNITQYLVGGEYNAANIQASLYTVDASAVTYGALRRAADGSIYVVNQGNRLAAISNPNNGGAAAGWIANAFTPTPPAAVTVGLPNVTPTCFRPPGLYTLIDSFSTDEDVTLSAASFLDNDYAYLNKFDSAGVQILTTPVNGSFSYSVLNGNFTYTPGANYFGTDSLQYRVCDVYGNCDTNWVRLYINSINDSPVATNDNLLTLEDTPITAGVIGNDTDVDGTIVASTFTIVTNGVMGTATGDAAGNISYTPNADATGLDSVQYSIEDNLGAGDSGWVRISITPVNDPPVVVDDAVTLFEDTPMATGLLGNDSDIDGTINTSSIVIRTSAANGSLTVSTGNVTYSPNLNFYGVDSFQYSVADDAGAADSAWVRLTINPVNDPPAVVDDSGIGVEDTPLIMSPLTNDSDIDGTLDTTSLSLLATPSMGTVSINSDGTITYNPDPGFYGDDSITYQVCDDGGLCGSAKFYITIDPNIAPTAVNDVGIGVEDTPLILSVLDNDGDVDGTLDTASLSVTAAPENGVAVANADGTITFTPSAHFFGADTFYYQICDNDGDCAIARVNLSISSVNDIPIVVDDAIMVQEDTPITWGILDNDSDVENGLDTSSFTILTAPVNGAVTIGLAGMATYTPNTNYHGLDSAEYEICDVDGDCSTGWIRYTVNEINDAPVANPDAATVLEDTPIIIGVVDNDTDVEGNIDYSSVSILTPADNGYVTVVSLSAGTIRYTPFDNFHGTDSIEYNICDDSSACSSNWIRITILPQNDPPQVLNDVASTNAATSITINVLNNDNDDLDPLGGIDPTSLTITAGADHGSVSASGSSFVYTPSGSYTGVDSFSYQVCDFGYPLPSLCGEATVIVTIAGTYPEGVADVVSTDQTIPVTINVLDNDDAEANPLCVTLESNPSNGTATVNPDGTITYTSTNDFLGTDCFTYSFCNYAGLQSEPVQVCVEVNELFSVDVPIIFTPNGDGVNDQLFIDGLEDYTENELFVYDRSGELVYRKQFYQNNWEGRHQNTGEPVTDGTYFYFLELGAPSGVKHRKKGHTTIAR